MPMLKDKLFLDGGQDVEVPAHLNFGKYMFDKIRHFGNKVAVHNATTDDELTYINLTQQAVDLSIGFSNLGMGKGDVVVLGIDQRILFVPTSLGIIFTGATMATADINSGKANLQHRLTVIPPTYLICTGAFWEMYHEILEDVKTIKAFITLDDIPKSAVAVESLLQNHHDVEMFTPAEVKGQEDVAAIYYSSGTTGLPKAVQLTHLNCILHSIPDDYLSFTTAFHFGIFYGNYHSFKTYKFLAGGKKIVYSEKREMEAVLYIFAKHKVEIVFTIPATIYALINSNDLLQKYDLSSLKIIYSRSSPLHAKCIEKLKHIFKGIEVFQGYGMTECAELTSEIRGSKGPKPGSVGIPSRGIMIKLADLQTGDSLPPYKQGEICVKGAAVMKGYINVDPSTYCEEEGFFKTGDLGYYDEDGYFYIIDRLKEIMIVAGFNVASIELETLLQLHPGVNEAGVVGKSDEVIGDLPTAFVVRQPGSNVTEQELKDYITAEVPSHMQLKGGVIFTPELPRNARRKILRRRLREILNEY